MGSLASYIARDTRIELGRPCRAVRPAGGLWEIDIDGAPPLRARSVVVTAPLPAALALWPDAMSDAALQADLRDVGFDPTLCALLVLGGPSGLVAPGAIQLPGGQPGGDGLSWVADNAQKGISEVPALTVHAGGRWSREHWDEPDAAILAELGELAAPFLGRSKPVATALRRWRLATPTTTVPRQCHVVGHPAGGLPLVMAGDAFAGPRVEGAALSGLAAAAAVVAAAGTA